MFHLGKQQLSRSCLPNIIIKSANYNIITVGDKIFPGKQQRYRGICTTVRSKIDKNGMALGTWSLLPSPHVVEILARYGFDFTVIDCEHGVMSMETAENLVRACNASGIAPYLRVPEKNKKMVNFGLEIGAVRIIVPDIRTADELKQVVSWTTYGLNGRGGCPFSRDSYERRPLNQTWEEFERQAPEKTGIIALVESPEGIKNLREIVSVPGLKGLIIGPFDLSVSSGWHGNMTHPELIPIMEKAVEMAISAGVTPVVPVFGANLESNSAQIRKWKKKGERVFTASCDKALLGESAGLYNNILRKQEE